MGAAMASTAEAKQQQKQQAKKVELVRFSDLFYFATAFDWLLVRPWRFDQRRMNHRFIRQADPHPNENRWCWGRSAAL